MKRVFLMIIAALFMAVGTIQAQEQGDMAIGENIALGIISFSSGDNYSNVGVGVKFQYNVIDNLRFEPSFTYFFEKGDVSMLEIDLNVHYQFILGDSFVVYPLIGLSFLNTIVPKYYTDVHSRFDYRYDLGFNAGVGVDYILTDAINLNAEIKYRVGDIWGRTIASIGAVYKF